MQADKRTDENWKAYLKSLAPASAKKYGEWCESFNEWTNEHKDESLAQNLLDYFESCHDHGYSTSTLWSATSMFKTYLRIKFSFDMQNQVPLLFRKLKNWETDEATTQSSVFTKEQLDTFIQSAPSDNHYLPIKACAIISTFGLLRNQEQVEFKFSDLSTQGSLRMAQVLRKKGRGTQKTSSFIIDGELYVKVLDDYVSRFDKKQISECEGRFLRRLTAKGNGTVQVIGKNMLASYPNQIADFLKLPEPERFTGHAFRRTGATLLSNSGVSLLMLKQAGGWKSDSVAQRYIEESDIPKREIASRIASGSAQTVKLADSEPASSNTTSNSDGTGSVTYSVSVDMSHSTISNVNIFIPGFSEAMNFKNQQAIQHQQVSGDKK